MDARRGLHQYPGWFGAVEPVEKGRRRATQGADEVGVADQLLSPGNAMAAGVDRLGPEHQPGKVEHELVGRHVGALGIAQLAVEAEVEDQQGS